MLSMPKRIRTEEPIGARQKRGERIAETGETMRNSSSTNNKSVFEGVLGNRSPCKVDTASFKLRVKPRRSRNKLSEL